MGEESNNINKYIPTRRPPSKHRTNARQSGTTLASSFKQFVGNASSTEIEEFSTQLNEALNAVSINDDETATATDKDSNNLRGSQRRPSEGEFYAPQPTSRRNSKVGEQLLASMKQTAADLLAELGDLDDDDDIDVGGLGTLTEESVQSI